MATTVRTARRSLPGHATRARPSNKPRLMAKPEVMLVMLHVQHQICRRQNRCRRQGPRQAIHRRPARPQCHRRLNPRRPTARAACHRPIGARRRSPSLPTSPPNSPRPTSRMACIRQLRSSPNLPNHNPIRRTVAQAHRRSQPARHNSTALPPLLPTPATLIQASARIRQPPGR